MADLAICGIDFQRTVLHIRFHLDLYNQLPSQTQLLHAKTFDKPTPADRQALIDNMEEAYGDAGIRAEIIKRAVAELRKRFSSAATGK